MKKYKKTKCSKYASRITKTPEDRLFNVYGLILYIGQAYEAGYNARKREEKKK